MQTNPFIKSIMIRTHNRICWFAFLLNCRIEILYLRMFILSTIRRRIHNSDNATDNQNRGEHS